MSPPRFLSGTLSSFLPPTSLSSLWWVCPGKRLGDDIDGAVEESSVGEDTVEGNGCFLGRPGPLLFFTAMLSGVGTLFCCPWLLESPCKTAVTETEGEGRVEAGGEGWCKWQKGNETDVDQ